MGVLNKYVIIGFYSNDEQKSFIQGEAKVAKEGLVEEYEGQYWHEIAFLNSLIDGRAFQNFTVVYAADYKGFIKSLFIEALSPFFESIIPDERTHWNLFVQGEFNKAVNVYDFHLELMKHYDKYRMGNKVWDAVNNNWVDAYDHYNLVVTEHEAPFSFEDPIE